MANYFDYLSWRGDLSFDKDPFNEIDSSILAEVSYFPFERFEERVNLKSRIGELSSELLQDPDLEEMVLGKRHIQLMKDLVESERFRDLRVIEFKNIFDERDVVQFPYRGRRTLDQHKTKKKICHQEQYPKMITY